jgi:hypothetical protein
MCSDPKYLVQPAIIRSHHGSFPLCAGPIRLLTIVDCQVGCPIRRSRDRRVLSPPPGLSQSATSFIASCCQGIHQTPFSRLIRSRSRRALLRLSLTLSYRASRYLRTWFNPTRLLAWTEVLTRWLAPPATAEAVISVSVIDLERLSLVSRRASRHSRTVAPPCRQTPDAPAPHSDRTQKRLVFRSLHDVS